MNAPAAERYTVALQGFSEFERGALSSFFRLAAVRTPAYVQVPRLDRSDFVIADADHGASLLAVLSAGRTHDTIFVGAQAPEGAMAWLPRPIDPMHIVRELDSLVEQRNSSPGELHAARAPLDDAAGGDARTGGEPSALGSFASTFGTDVLVAEDSAIARRFLQRRLQQLGYRVHLAQDGEEAMALLAQQHFALVFLDVLLGPPGSLDGLAICQRLKHDPDFAGKRAPGVILVTGLGGEVDRVRGSLAGCDAYLTKPIVEAELLQALRALDPGFGQGHAAG